MCDVEDQVSEPVKYDLAAINCMQENHPKPDAPSPKNQVDTTSVDIEVKLNQPTIEKWQETCKSAIAEKENKKICKKTTRLLKKKRKTSDPIIKNISELMSNSLKIISPDKSYKGLTTMEAVTPVESNKIHTSDDETDVKTSASVKNNDKCDVDDLETVSDERNDCENNSNGQEEKTANSEEKQSAPLSTDNENSQDIYEEEDVKQSVFYSDSDDSQGVAEKKKTSKRRKHSRLSLKSPKGKKFKDCSQQSKLNAFIQIKSPENLFENKESKDVNKLKLSHNLFKSPRVSKKDKEKSQPGDKKEPAEETVISEESQDTPIISLADACEEEDPSTTKRDETTASPRQSRKGTPAKKSSTTRKSKHSKLTTKKTNGESAQTFTSPTKNLKSEAEVPTTPQRNAFQFMMNQRGKVIGSNSPGKDTTDSPTEEKKDLKERKERLSKRKQQFSEWNDSKGGTKRKMEEDEQELKTKKVLTSRAKLMKEMLTGEVDEEDVSDCDKKKVDASPKGDKKKKLSKTKKTPGRKRKRVVQPDTASESSNDVPDIKQEEVKASKRSRLDIPEPNEEEKSTGKIQKDLLNFFGVLQKDSSNESAVQVYDDEAQPSGGLKVKMLTPRRRRKKTSLSLKKEQDDDLTDDDEILANIKKKLTSSKTKASITTDDEVSQSSNMSNFSDMSESGAIKKTKKSKGKTKKTPEVNLNQISFASIKNKLLSKLNNPIKPVVEVPIDDGGDNDEVQVVDDKAGTRRSTRKKTAPNYSEYELETSESKTPPIKEDKEREKKVAPVFLKSTPKPKEDPAVVKARLDFLRSGVPSTLKKITEKQQSIEEIDFDVFPLISHVQPKDSNPSTFCNLSSIKLNLREIDDTIPEPGLLKLGTVTLATSKVSSKIKLRPLNTLLKYKTILEVIKEENPEYPVYKSFRLLCEKAGRSFEKPVSPLKTPTSVKRKRGRPRRKPVIDDDVIIVEEVSNNDLNPADHTMWTEKYRPKSSQDIVGNYKSVTELKDWLNCWIEFSREMGVSRKKRRCDSSDFESTDGESRDSVKLPCNTMILQGPLGSGKSVTVYAVCQELGVNVLEVNASSKRTGKKLLQDMQEATQSHQVGKKDNNSLTSFLQKEKVPKEIQEAKSNTQNKICVLLIEDADIVFEQDEGFVSALSQLILTSKRPVILLTSNVDCNYMQKFTSTYPVLQFSALSAKTLATWLQIVCLLEGVHLDKNSIGELLEWNKGDVRRTLLQLQFWVQSGGMLEEDTSCTTSLYKKYCELNNVSDEIHSEDDKSSILSNFKELETTPDSDLQSDCVKSFIVCSRNKFSIPYPINLGTVWWNLPDLLDFPAIKHKDDESEPVNDENGCTVADSKEELAKLQSIGDVFDAVAFTDVLYRTEGFDRELEPCPTRWEDGLKEGLSLKENTLDYKTDRCLTQEITHSLVQGYCRLHNPDFNSSINMAVPVLTERRWRSKRHDCEGEYFNAVPLSYAVHRTAFATDYFPVLRTISRTEFERAQNNNKRGNRFYNYLRTLNMNPNSSTIQTACNIFNARV